MDEQRQENQFDEIANILVDYFFAFFNEINAKSGTMTDDPEAQPLIAALQREHPFVGANSPLVKLFLTFAGGVDAGIEIAQQIGEGAQK